MELSLMRQAYANMSVKIQRVREHKKPEPKKPEPPKRQP
jgi:hypothetical protein